MKTAVITGGASGIGEALVKAYLAEGFKVIAVDVNEVLGENLVTKLGQHLRFIYADLSSVDGVNYVLENLSDAQIDVLVHSAGINHTTPFESSSLAKQKKVLDVNLKAPILLTQKLVEAGKMPTASSVVFIASLSHQLSYPGASVYAASKDGVTSFARSLGVALKPKGIHVLTVFPGPTRTPHAREHSPDNSREDKRMSPELLAQKILRATKQKHSRLVPSFALRVFAFIGTYLPFITERIMVKSLYQKMPEVKRESTTN